MAENEEDKLQDEMAKRLEDLFTEGEEDSPESGFSESPPLGRDSGSGNPGYASQQPAVDPPSVESVDSMADQGGAMSNQHILRELKATILSMDWEITDEVMARLIEQIEQVKRELGQERGIYLLLKVLGTVGSYIKINKGRSHPNAINVIKSTYSGIERLAQNSDLDEADRKRTVLEGVKNFKALKAQIEHAPAGAAVPAGAAAAVSDEAAQGFSATQIEALRSMVTEVVRQELATLKRQLVAELSRR